jgi:prepilin peptidase CpaA
MIAVPGLVVLPLLLIVAAARDVATLKIPNWVPLTMVAAFAAIAPFSLSSADLIASVLAGAVVLAAGLGLFAVGWIGGGDAKLLAATALWIGMPGLPELAFFTVLAGGGLSLALLGARRGATYLPSGRARLALTRLLSPHGDIPYGLAIAAGGLAAFPQSAMFRAALGA